MASEGVSRRTLAWVGGGLVGAAAFVLVPFWAPLLLAAWTAELVQRPYRWLVKLLGGRQRGAAAATVLLVIALIIPVGFIVLSLSGDAIELVKRAIASGSTSSALRTVVSADKTDGDVNAKELFDFAQKHGAGVWQVAQVLFGAAVTALVGAFLFIFAVYEFLVNGPRVESWVYEHSPIARQHLARFAAAFSETGHGLFVGVGLTAVGQGLGAMIGYFALGIPQAAVLGLLTCIASLVPSFGSGLVWVPVTAGLALTGRPGAAVIMGAIGVVISLADNVLLPMLSRYGRLKMSTFLLLLAMLGGIAVFGAWGLVLGPLIVRLAIEACRIMKEERLVGSEPTMTLVSDSTRPAGD